MIYIDEIKFFELLDKAIAERGPEYIYEQACVESEDGILGSGQGFCLYVDVSMGEMRPSCLVGLMLHLAGVPLDKLHQNNYAPSNGLLSWLERRGYITLSPHDLIHDYFAEVQSRQDHGETWGSIADIFGTH
jgi:hypothetical protein